MSRAWTFPLVALCFFLSGMAGLVYETAWTRQFAFVFGTSNLAVATVLAAYMGGLAAGAAIAGRLARRIRRPVLVYGLLELGIAIAALGVPMAVGASRVLYVALFGGLGDLPAAGGLATAIFYGIASFVILLIPTALMGATLPLLIRHSVEREDQIGSRSGLLYSVNTAGAVAGVLVASFVLLPEFGLQRTIWLAAGLNTTIFLAAWALSRQAGPPPAPATTADRTRASFAGWILPLIACSGMVSFSYEVLWVRLLGHIVGGSLYSFATMLASFLAGIALGAAVASRLATSAARAAVGFGISQLAIAGLSVAAFLGVGKVAELVGAAHTGGLSSANTIVTGMLTLFPAALAIGATFPFALRILARDEADAGPASARVYAFNTLGSIVGSVASGFFLIPALGFAGTLILCVAANLLLAAVSALVFLPGRRRRVLVALTAAAALALTLGAPSTPWSVLRSGPLDSRGPSQGDATYLGFGRAATVLLLESGRSWSLRTNGLPEARIRRAGTWHNRTSLVRWLSAIPVLTRPEAKNLLVVGLGGGVALEVLPHPLERVDVIELEPEVVAANRAVGDERWRDPLSDPRVHMHLNDARNALLLTDRRFDAISSQPSHPWSSGASHLYTREFFELAKTKLAPGGVFVQWIGLSFVDESLLRSLLATLNAVYANVRVYKPNPGGGVLFVSSDAPIDVDETSARAIEAAPADFHDLAIRTPEDVSMWLILDEEATRELAAGAREIRDQHNILQTGSPRALERSLRGQRGEELFAPYEPLLATAAATEESDSARDSLFYMLSRLPPPRAMHVAAALTDLNDREVASALASLRAGRLPAARRKAAAVLASSPRHPQARAVMLLAARPAIANGQDPAEWVSLPLSAAEAAITSGWQHRKRGDFQSLEMLDSQLAAIEARDLLRDSSDQLRTVWRIDSGLPERGREALRLAKDLVSNRGRAVDILLLAQASYVSGQAHEITLDMLYTLLVQIRATAGGGGHNRAKSLAREALPLARQIPADAHTSELRKNVIAALESWTR